MHKQYTLTCELNLSVAASNLEKECVGVSENEWQSFSSSILISVDVCKDLCFE